MCDYLPTRLYLSIVNNGSMPCVMASPFFVGPSASIYIVYTIMVTYNMFMSSKILMHQVRSNVCGRPRLTSDINQHWNFNFIGRVRRCRPFGHSQRCVRCRHPCRQSQKYVRHYRPWGHSQRCMDHCCPCRNIQQSKYCRCPCRHIHRRRDRLCPCRPIH